jgi:hypothetical protein
MISPRHDDSAAFGGTAAMSVQLLPWTPLHNLGKSERFEILALAEDADTKRDTPMSDFSYVFDEVPKSLGFMRVYAAFSTVGLPWMRSNSGKNRRGKRGHLVAIQH